MIFTSDIEQFNAFCEKAMLDKKHHPWAEKRKKNEFYANVLITKCPYDDWWFKDFVGLEVFARIIMFNNRNTGNKYLYRVEPCLFSGSLIHKGRDLPIDCISII